ncbi:hypothetical protein SeMB42_g00716 [Synchytrium endobioticum]|uniref:Dynein heavy chain, cytosolic n=1 Tax=Synchytrium endobioticum TaxID=286115 RepID=A0A507DRF3_9FUNG|nr:hypothetical protein SeMB42_g00716 [Synchytrium endobioticum]
MSTTSFITDGHQLQQAVALLTRYNPQLWTPEHDAIRSEFLNNPLKHSRLVAFVEAGPHDHDHDHDYQLRLQFTMPSHAPAIDDIVYFLHHDNHPANIQVGLVKGNTLDSLLHVMQDVYSPLLSANTRWPETVRKDFDLELQRFMAFLTDAANMRKGATVLYIPKEQLEHPKIAARNKDVVQRLESLLLYWTRQIKSVVAGSRSSETSESSGPLEEIQFWKSRCDDLSGISQQLKGQEIGRVINVLQVAQSSYLEAFTKLAQSIQENTQEAQDNLKYLSTLTAPCQTLATAEPKAIAASLPRLLTTVRLIWTNSKYFATREKVTALLRQISNEIIRRCCAFISLDNIFHKDAHAGLAQLHEAIACTEAWKNAYKTMTKHLARHADRVWLVDESSIFSSLEAFQQRCRDLAEVCEAQIQFARKVPGGSYSAPIPVFGGSNGPATVKSLESMEAVFKKNTATLWTIHDSILDVKHTRWHDYFGRFKEGLKDLEVMMQAIISNAFETALSVEQAVELLEIFHHLAKRETIKRVVERKTADTWIMYINELNLVKELFEKHKRTPDLLRSNPDYAGSANWARTLLRRITCSMTAFSTAYYLPRTTLANDATSQYEPLVAAIEDYITKQHTEWVATASSNLAQKLETTLMSRYGGAGSPLDVKFDKNLLRLFAEVHYWQKTKSDVVPFHCQELHAKREELRILRENVLLVVRDYNIVMETLSPEEMLLFRERIRLLDRKINPGLTSLTWASKNITDYFVKECRRVGAELQKTVAEFMDANQKIRLNCKLIAETLLWRVESKRIYESSEFSAAQDQHRVIVREKLKSAHESIKQTLLSVFEFFRNDGREVLAQWALFVARVDKMVEEALRLTVKRSLQDIAKAINGEGKSRDSSVQPLFKVNVMLENQKVDFSPTLTKLEEIVLRVAKDMLMAVSVAGRFSQLLGIDPPSRQPITLQDELAKDEDILKILLSIQNGMANNATKCQAHLRVWDGYREIWEINKDAFIRRYAKLKPALSTFDADIGRYGEVANNIQKEETLTNINFIRLDSSPLKHQLVIHCTTWSGKLTTLLKNNMITELTGLHQKLSSSSERLKQMPVDVDELSESITLCTKLRNEIPAIETQFAPIHDQFSILEKYEVPISDEERALLESLQTSWINFQQTLADAEIMLQEYKTKFKAQLIASIEEFGKRVDSLREDFNTKGPFSATLEVEKAQKLIQEYHGAAQQAKSQDQFLRKGMAVFHVEHRPGADIDVLVGDVERLRQIWMAYEEWSVAWSQWSIEPLSRMNVAELDDTVQKFTKRLSKIVKDVADPPPEVLRNLQERLAQLVKTVPIVSDLKSPALRPRHWNHLMEETGKIFDSVSEDFTLARIMALEFNAEVVSQVAMSATEESLIEMSLEAIDAAWTKMDLTMVPFKDERKLGFYKIQSTDDIMQLVEDQQVKLSAIKCSKYVAAFEEQVELWEQVLVDIIDSIDALLSVQSTWLYLESIFATDDIKKQLPKESAFFEKVNKTWKDALVTLAGNRTVLKALKLPDLNKTLMDLHSNMEKIRKSLDLYLHVKRTAFPRFFFLSSEELLDILGQAKDPQSVQPHIRKLFDNVVELDLVAAGTDSRRHFEITGMRTGDGEYLPLAEAIVIDSPVESWLADFTSKMQATLRNLIPGCVAASKNLKRDKWIRDWPGQVILSSALILWTSETAKALQDSSSGDKPALRELKKQQMSGLKKLAELARGSTMSEHEQLKCQSLITLDLHSRDVTDVLIKKATGAGHYSWLSQMRFYWEKSSNNTGIAAESGDLVIRQTNAQFAYGYEVTSIRRLVLTPLTDRALSTLTTAVSVARGGSLQGPAGIGKTETVKELGRTMGKLVLVYNCSKAMDYRTLARIFAGLVQTGAWGCFDEFNRLEADILGVITTVVSSVLHAIRLRVKTLILDGQEMALDTSLGIFITMNPNFAGWNELPETLAALFRPVALLFPDSASIAENLLVSQGFSTCHALATRVDLLFAVAAQQLSSQRHYDFGLRALTRTIRVAGIRRRLNPTVPDEVVVFTALLECTMPKLINADVPVFNAIMKDIFPGVDATVAEKAQFAAALISEVEAACLQPTADLLLKITQLHEIHEHRPGIALIGQTGAGKSTIWKTLVNTVNRMATMGTGLPVRHVVVNPKVYSVGELYGRLNPNSNEWEDGLLSGLLRQVCRSDSSESRWVVLDGPVDPTWVENLNTALDETRLLTLNNGERVVIPDHVKLVFESSDLDAASPATVSRCSIIYVNNTETMPKQYMDSWLRHRQINCHASETAILYKLVEKWFDSCLKFWKTVAGEDCIHYNVQMMVKTFSNLLEAYISKDNGVDPDDTDSYSHMLELWFLFALIWSFGSPLKGDGRRRFDTFVRDLEGQFPPKDTVFDYYVSPEKKNWAGWDEKLPVWKFPPGAPFHKLFVPTVETVRNEFLIHALTKIASPILLMGELGAGKSAIIQNAVRSNVTSSSILHTHLSTTSTAVGLQNALESAVERRHKNVFGPPSGKLTFMIEDLNLPRAGRFGSQPSIELVRHLLTYGELYEPRKQTSKQIVDVFVIGSVTLGGFGSPISSRAQAAFNLLHIPEPTNASLHRIMSLSMSQLLQDFEETIKPLGETLTAATVELYRSIAAKLLPTPAKVHYIFNQRDVMSVIQGLMRARSEYYDSPDSLMKLWTHEVCRVFSDRLISVEDENTFEELLDYRLQTHMNVSLKQIQTQDGYMPVFSDVLDSGDKPVYEEITDVASLKAFFESKLDERNNESGNHIIDLVLFRDAIEHICRLTRVLRLPGGNALLVGVGGSGRQSLARLAAYVLDMRVYQLRTTQRNSHDDFREDLKSLYRRAAIENQKVLILTTDRDIMFTATAVNGPPPVSDLILDDLANLVNTGRVFGLFSDEELAEMKRGLKTNKAATTDASDVFGVLKHNIRTNLHLVLYYFWPWNATALQEVAAQRLKDACSDTEGKLVVDALVSSHLAAVEQATKSIETGRPNHITPSHYLDLLRNYQMLIVSGRQRISTAVDKLKNGLNKLDETRKAVEVITVESAATKRHIAEFSRQCEQTLVTIVSNSREADETAKVVAAKAEKLGAEEEEVKVLADAAQADLDQATPALRSAEEALNSISKKDLTELKSFAKPSPAVVTVMEAVMTLLKKEPTWDEAKRQLGDLKFMQNVLQFDRDNISDKILRRITQYTTDENFQPDIVGRASSAAKGLCLWVRAMETYGQIFRQVGPKKEKLRQLQDQLEKKRKSLQEARAKYTETQEKLAELKVQYEEKLSLKEKLKQESSVTEQRLVRAEQLVSGLANERARWEKVIVSHEETLARINGHTVLASVFLSYAANFSSTSRAQLLNNIRINNLESKDIAVSPAFSVVDFLSDENETRIWRLNGLPPDSFATENALLVTLSRKWPLLVDPHGHGAKWLAKSCSVDDNNNMCKILNASQSSFYPALDHAIQNGIPTIITNMGDSMDHALDPLLSKSLLEKDKKLYINLGQKLIPYNTNFKLFLVTSLSKPIFSPEVFAKLTIVDFAVTEAGVQEHLLGSIIQVEQPELEEQKGNLAIAMAAARIKLAELEDEILKLLNSSKGSLLEDEALVTALQTSKSTSEEIGKQLATSELTAKRVDTARKVYQPCAHRATILFYVMAGFAEVNALYYTSMDTYVELMQHSLGKGKRSEDINDRISAMNENHTFAVYKYMCRVLFEEHKLLFAFQLAVKILESTGKLNTEEYSTLFRPLLRADDGTLPPNVCREWLDDGVWDRIIQLDKIPSLQGIVNSFEQNEREWSAWYISVEPERIPLPGEWENKANDLQRILIVRTVRPDRFLSCATTFVKVNLGQRFIDRGPLELADFYPDSSPLKPIVFVIVAGADLSPVITELVKKHNMVDKFTQVGLGFSQHYLANKLLSEAAQDGEWILLENCPLSDDWQALFEQFWEGLDAQKSSPSFRIFISLPSAQTIPHWLHDRCVKVVLEQPKGIKAHLTRLVRRISEDEVKSSPNPQVYRRLMFALCVFHSIVMERKRFRNLGWNMMPDFNGADFEVCAQVLSNSFDADGAPRYDLIRNLIAETHYGGHLSDEWDKRVLRSYCMLLFCETAVTTAEYRFSPSETYYLPDATDAHSLREYISLLPTPDTPEVFGQNGNADVVSKTDEAIRFLDALRVMDKQDGVAVISTTDSAVSAIIGTLMSRIPTALPVSTLGASPFRGIIEQECTRYNGLLTLVHTSLTGLQHGLRGTTLMTPDLEATIAALSSNRVPEAWSHVYLSSRPLNLWVDDLLQRLDFFNAWISRGDPETFWLGAFTRPSAFLTAVVQRSARARNVPLDRLQVDISVAHDEHDDAAQPADGVLLRGVYLEGAGWDVKNNCLCDARPMELYTPLPVLFARVLQDKKKHSKGMFVCPVFSGFRHTRAEQAFTLTLKCGVNDAEFYIRHNAGVLLTQPR